MADLIYDDLRTEYGAFDSAVGIVYLAGERFADNKAGFGTTNISVENTCGFEASVATFDITNAFDETAASFDYDSLKKYIALGTCVVIYLGYNKTLKEVFRGFVASVNFRYEKDADYAAVAITAMDIKGIMMSGNYSNQLKATTYIDAVSEIFKRTNYSKIVPASTGAAGMGGASAMGAPDNSSIVTKLDVAPEKAGSSASGAAGGGAGGKSEDSDITIEMVAESDYEFVVKAAKKLNYEFFTTGGIVHFRKARSKKEVLMDITPLDGIVDYDIEYNISGLVNEVEVRALDPGKAKLISSKKKLNNKISYGNKAKGLIGGISKVYIDPTVKSKEDADNRAEYLAESIAYSFGTARIEMIGLPELVPGRFITIEGMGFKKPPQFYITQVVHTFTTQGSYTTKIIAQCCALS